MKTSTAVTFLSLLVGASVSGFTDLGNSVLRSSGTLADTQDAVNAASDGYTIVIPAGSFTWSGVLSISGKGIALRGAGSGRVIGRSTTSVSVGAGTKTFTTQAGLPIKAGDTLRIYHTPNGVNTMLGTVTSYSGTSLTLNVTSSGGSGTWAFWVISTIPQTTLIAGTARMIAITADTTHVVEVSDLKMVASQTGAEIFVVAAGTTEKPVLVHDCWYSAPGNMRLIRWECNRGVMWNCSFDNAFKSGGGSGNGNDAKAIAVKSDSLTSSWSTPSTMGAADTTGLNNFYMEDCDFHGMYLAAYDFDDNARAVLRHCLFNNSGGGSHGADTSTFGVRHMEIYNNEFVFTDASNSETFNINHWIFNRGGTAVITDNIMQNIISSEWSDKPELRFIVMNLRRSGGPYACWQGYPAPRQIGQGHNGTSYITEPVYIWNNTGGGVENPAIIDYDPDECGNGQSSADYLHAGRDYFVGTAKPGYTKYTYPHPARNVQRPSPPTGLRVSPGG